MRDISKRSVRPTSLHGGWLYIWEYSVEDIEHRECTGNRMTLVTAKTLNYAWNEISETPVIDYELPFDSRAYKQPTTATQYVQTTVHIHGSVHP